MFERDSVILVDMDGVLADFDKSLQEAWTNHPLVVQNGWLPWVHPEDVSGQATRDNLRSLWGQEAADVYTDISRQEGFYRDLEPITRAVEGMHLLDSLGHRVFICTAPSRHVLSCASEKIAWAGEHLGKEWIARTIITKDKTLVLGDYLIDDKRQVSGIKSPVWMHVKFSSPTSPVGHTWDTIIDSLLLPPSGVR